MFCFDSVFGFRRQLILGSSSRLRRSTKKIVFFGKEKFPDDRNLESVEDLPEVVADQTMTGRSSLKLG